VTIADLLIFYSGA
jgi:hypothetical protein